MPTPANIAPALQLLATPVDKLQPYPGNARNGDTDAIQTSLATHGQYAPVVYQASTGYIVKGNHVFHSALALGWGEVAATPLDVTDEQARRIVLVDNRTSDLGRYDEAALADLLVGLDNLDGTGFTPDDLDDLLAQLDRIAETPLQPFTGDYAESQDETDARGSNPGAGHTYESRGLKEAVLVLPLADYEAFTEACTVLRKRWDEDSTARVVLTAVTQLAKQL